MEFTLSVRSLQVPATPGIGPRIERVLETGEATWDEGLLLFLERSGYPGGNLPHILLFALGQRRGPGGRHAVRRHRRDRTHHRRTAARQPARTRAEIAGKHTRPEVLAAVEQQLDNNLEGPAVHADLSVRRRRQGAPGLCHRHHCRAIRSRPPSSIPRIANAVWPAAEMLAGERGTHRRRARSARRADPDRRLGPAAARRR